MTATLSTDDNPGVRFPPPILYFAAIGIGWLLSRRIPFAIGGAFPRVLGAWILIGIWGAITGASMYAFWRRRTSIIPIRPATALVASGPYRFTRNPMYLALAALTLGAGLWMNTWWVILLLAPVLLAIDGYVIAREEAYLHRRFGATYGEFTQQVRRWL